MTKTFIHAKLDPQEYPTVICTNLPIISHDGIGLYLGSDLSSTDYVVPMRYMGYWWFSLNGRANVYGGNEPGKWAVLPSDVLMGYWKPAIGKGTNYFSAVLAPVTGGSPALKYDFYAFTDIVLGPTKGEYVKPVKQFQIGTI